MEANSKVVHSFLKFFLIKSLIVVVISDLELLANA